MHLMAALIVPPPQSVLSQDLIAQFTDDDAAKIQVAVAGNVQLWLIWSAMLAQRDPMVASNAPSSRMGGAGTGARTTPHEHDRHRARPYHRGREPINSSDRRASALERITDSSRKSRQLRFVPIPEVAAPVPARLKKAPSPRYCRWGLGNVLYLPALACRDI
jgi:hypothetical protein